MHYETGYWKILHARCFLICQSILPGPKSETDTFFLIDQIQFHTIFELNGQEKETLTER